MFPGPATASSAQFRVIALGDERPILVTSANQPVDVIWEPPLALEPGVSRIRVGTAQVKGLPSDTEFVVRALQNGAEAGRAQVRTLPSQLSTPGSEFRMFLASCFCRLNPRSRNARDLFDRLFGVHGTPHLKVWCGDQVYLDSPATFFMKHWDLSHAEIDASHLDHYLRTWSDEYLGRPLARGANIFAPDDHEYWNNAPFPNVVVPGLHDEVRRGHWQKTAGRLMQAFQGIPEYLASPIRIPPVSLLVLDTRSARKLEDDPIDFLQPSDLALFRNWVASLKNTGPGILVLGQPIFLGKGASLLKPRLLEDFSLADYEQFGEFLRILGSAERDILILSGDVHFSRAAQMRLPNGHSIYEVINSPLALVVGLGRSTPDEATGFKKIPGVGALGSAKAETDSKFKSNADSAIVLGISQSGLHMNVNVELWASEASTGPQMRHSFKLL